MSRQESNKLIEDARLLLPWYLTNTLSDAEQDLVNRALEASEELRNEFVREEKMMRLVKDNTSLLELNALDTTEQRLANTLARIDREDQMAERLSASAKQQSSGQKAPSALDSLWQRLRGAFDGGLFGAEWLTPANAVLAGLLSVNVGVMAIMSTSPGNDTQYISQSFEPAPISNAQPDGFKSLFLMEFQGSAQHGEVCKFLNDWNARIVAGPNNQNMFTVEMKTDKGRDAVALADNVMEHASQGNAPVVFIGPKFNGQ